MNRRGAKLLASVTSFLDVNVNPLNSCCPLRSGDCSTKGYGENTLSCLVMTEKCGEELYANQKAFWYRSIAETLDPILTDIGTQPSTGQARVQHLASR